METTKAQSSCTLDHIFVRKTVSQTASFREIEFTDKLKKVTLTLDDPITKETSRMVPQRVEDEDEAPWEAETSELRAGRRASITGRELRVTGPGVEPPPTNKRVSCSHHNGARNPAKRGVYLRVLERID